MGDFLIDFRPREERAAFMRSAAFLKFQEHVALETLEFDDFSLALTSVDLPSLWAKYCADDLLAVVCGRIDLEESAWLSAEKIPGAGGLAAKYLAGAYRQRGADALREFSGNFTLLLWDRAKGRFYIVTDRCGALPVFQSTKPGATAFSSHPDALALCLGEDHNWDTESFAEFLLTGCVTSPYSYYKSIESVYFGTIVWVDSRASHSESSTYYALEYRGDEKRREGDVAEELAQAFIGSIRRRTLSRIGPVAVALSGGLDSRTVLAAASNRENVFAFCCFDEENFEFRVARALAETLAVKLVPMARPFDYYAENADLGTRISGGMGTFANNHFLGMSGRLRELGAQNLLTGCYCDYLFKALPLNTTFNGLLRREKVGVYSHQFYFKHYRMDQSAAKGVLDRLEARFPERLRNSPKAEDIFELEKARTFPLFQEGDNAQRLIPQRVLHSYLPVADRAVVEMFCKIPYQIKLNRSVFKKAVEIICGPDVCAIPDANTGAPTNAGLLRESLHVNLARVMRKARKKKGIANRTSWPDWEYYVPNSQMLKDLWQRPSAAADELFKKVLPATDLRATPAEYAGRDLYLFVRMLSLKLWFQQRC